MKKKKALVISYSYSANLGDRAILEGMKNIFSSYNIELTPLQHSLNIKQLINKKQLTTKTSFIKKILKKILFIDLYKNLKTNYLPRFKYHKKLKNIISNYDFVIIGGGNLLMSVKSIVNAWDQYCLTKIASQAQKKIIYFSVGAGPIDNWLARKLFVYCLNKAHLISVRDVHSKNYLKNKLKIKKNIDIIHDPAFNLASNKNKKNQHIGIVTLAYKHPYFYPGGNLREYRQYLGKLKKLIIKELANKPKEKISLIATDYPMDYVCARDLFQQISDPRILKPIIYDSKSLSLAINHCKKIICTRMHSAILAAIYNTPLVLISWQPKTKALSQLLKINKQTIDINNNFDNLNKIKPVKVPHQIKNIHKHNNKIIKKIIKDILK